MYTKKQILRKLLIGAAALAVAVCITVIIRENMDVKDPDQALPAITITANEATVLPEESILRAGYEWNFLTTTAKNTPPLSSEDIQARTPPIDVLARTYLSIDFSLEPKSLVVSRSEESSYDTFLDLVGGEEGSVIAPSSPGVYLYRIQADFGWRGSIVYFFRVRVVQADA